MPKIAIELNDATLENVNTAAQKLEKQLAVQIQGKGLLGVIIGNMSSDDLVDLYHDHMKAVLGIGIKKK